MQAASRAGSASKRILDLALSALGILLTSPAWVVIPMAIKLEDGGPVLYGQPRVGIGGRIFISWKFRSMRPLSDPSAPPLQAHLESERITRVGRIIRPTALDELPQLLSVLRGEMSLVGPRPLAPEEGVAASAGVPTRVVRLEEMAGYQERQSVRPGLTGLAQVRASREAPHRVRIRYDLLYVRNRTLWLDLKLIVWSVWTSLTGAWPRAGRRWVRGRPGPGSGRE
jgi:lipopolysaccharide/colanic/teichoic acid biosynthesis glycosyltransferase